MLLYIVVVDVPVVVDASPGIDVGGVPRRGVVPRRCTSYVDAAVPRAVDGE